MPRAVILVVDMLNDFFRQKPELAEQRERLAKSINELVDALRDKRNPVIWVRQELQPDLSDGFLEIRKNRTPITITGTEGCEILPELHRERSDTTIVKKRYSAFFGTSLDLLLTSLAPDVLIVCGVNTHACIRTTVIDGYQRDYDVVVASDCVGSYDMVHHKITMDYLSNSIARVLTVQEILAGGIEENR